MRRYYILNLIFLKNELKIGRRPIKEKIIFLFNYVEKWTPNRPKADKGRYYIMNLIFLTNELKIGRKPVKGDNMFYFEFS
jgi:hypothetical protein